MTTPEGQGSFAGKVAVITGADGDIGMATMRLLARRGARVVAADKQIHADIESQMGDSLLAAICTDVADEQAVSAMVERTIALAGRIDILFNGAGIEGPVTPVTEYSAEAFARVLSVNVTGTFLAMKHVLPWMIVQGSGSIINASSTAGLTGAPNLSGYSASKHAVIGLTRSAAAENARFGVRVNCVNPGPVAGRMMEAIARGIDATGLASDAILARIPAGRFATADEIAAMVAFLASDEAQFVNGASMVVDGGRIAV